MRKEKNILFKQDMKISEIVHTVTEKNKAKTRQIKIKIESDEIVVTVKYPDYDEQAFVEGEDVLVTISQPQTIITEHQEG